jgi:hypothetical protein
MQTGIEHPERKKEQSADWAETHFSILIKASVSLKRNQIA